MAEVVRKEFLTVAEAAQKMNLHDNTVRSLLRLGTLTEYRLGPNDGAIRLSHDEVEAYIKGKAVRK